MPRYVKSASFEDRLTLVEHLDELRSRLIFSAIALVLVGIVCFWQNHAILDIANGPLPNDVEPITLSPTEPFLTTLTVVLYSAILITLPILLYQAYAFILPALSPREKKTILPMLLMVPVLFILGVVFAYFVVVPAAIKFLLNFNSGEFSIQIRAREYYGFFSLSLISVGILFQIPVGILALTRLGIVTPQTLAKNRRYAVLVCAVLAMLLPGTDPVTMLISMAPLVVLFEFSLVLSRMLGVPGDAQTPAAAVKEEAADVADDARDVADDVGEAITEAAEEFDEARSDEDDDDDDDDGEDWPFGADPDGDDGDQGGAGEATDASANADASADDSPDEGRPGGEQSDDDS